MASQLPPPLKFSDAIVGILGQLGIAKELCDGRIAWVCVDPAINLLQGNGETSSVRKVDMVIIDVDGAADGAEMVSVHENIDQCLTQYF